MIDGQSSPTIVMLGNVARGSATTLSALPNGSIAVVNMAGTVQTTAISGDTLYRIAAKGTDGSIVFSPAFSANGIDFKSYLAYSAPVQQVTVVGYNPSASTGAISVTNNVDYTLSVELLSTSGIVNNSAILKEVSYKSSNSASQEEIATGIVKAFNVLMVNEATPLVQAVRVSDGTATALVADATVVQGSTTVSCAAHALTAGTYVSLAGVTYKIVSVTTNAFVIDMPYLGTSGTVTKGTGATQGASLATVTNWGIKLTGQKIAINNPQAEEYYRTSFFTRFRIPSNGVFTDSGSPITSVTAPSAGNGTGYEVANKEYKTNFGFRDISVSSYPTTKIKQETNLSSTYDTFALYTIDSNMNIVTNGASVKSMFQIYLAVDSTLTTDTTSLKTVLGL